MKLFFLLFLLLAAAIQPALASPDGPRGAFERLSHCLAQQPPAQCRTLLTGASRPIYDRFVSYGLAACLPKDSAYVSEQVLPHGVLVRASSTASGQAKTVRLVFTQENGWKLNIPESLHTGLGENWKNQLDTTEQIYLMMRAQMGDQLNCGLLQGLAGKKQS